MIGIQRNFFLFSVSLGPVSSQLEFVGLEGVLFEDPWQQSDLVLFEFGVLKATVQESSWS